MDSVRLSRSKLISVTVPYHQEADHDQRRAVAKDRMAVKIGANSVDTRNRMPVTRAVRPVRRRLQRRMRLNEGGGGGSTQNCTCGGCNRVCQQSGFDARQLAVLIEHLHGGNTDQRAQSIENINEQEREDDNDEAYDADCAEIHVEALPEGRTQLEKSVKSPQLGNRGRSLRPASERKGRSPGRACRGSGQRQNAVQDGALHLAGVKYG